MHHDCVVVLTICRAINLEWSCTALQDRTTKYDKDAANRRANR